MRLGQSVRRDRPTVDDHGVDATEHALGRPPRAGPAVAVVECSPGSRHDLVMTSADSDRLCRRCGREVRVSAQQYDVFEQMHYVCFHYEFEHDPSDPDEECHARGCPSASFSGSRDHVVATAAELALEALQGAPWANDTLGPYLEALSVWLADSGGYYADGGGARPGNGWEVFADALRAATVYE